MPAANTDLLKKYLSLFSTTLSTSIGTGTSDTITPASVSGLPTDTAITITIDRVDSGGVATPTKMERIRGIISGGNLIDYVRGVDGTTEQAHTAGAVIEMVWNADDWNDMVDWALVSHNQSGYLLGSSVVASNISASAVSSGNINASAIIPGHFSAGVYATASDVATGTEDAKIVTPKAIKDAGIVAVTIPTDGWTAAGETWTYASATTITVPSGAAAKYVKGDKIKLTQTTVKYFYVIGVADTVLTVTGGSDYTVANAPITNNYYSHASSPIGFPSVLNWTPTLTGGNTDLSGFDTAIFSIEGKRLKLTFYAANKTLSGSAGAIQVTLPVSIDKGGSYSIGSFRYFVSGYVYARAEPATTYLNLYKGMTTEQWVANETGVYLILEAEYWI